MDRIRPCAAVVVAGGTGERFGRVGGKQLAKVSGLPVVSWALAAIDRAPEIDRIVLVCPPGRLDEYRASAVDPLGLAKQVDLVAGGGTRRESVRSALASIPGSFRSAVVHDGARPLVTPELLSRVLTMLDESTADGVVAGHPSTDTLKQVDDGRVLSTPERDSFWAVQTPQAFTLPALRDAHLKAECDGYEGTDDASLVERAGGVVLVCAAPRDNIKVTTPEDLAVVEALLTARRNG